MEFDKGVSVHCLYCDSVLHVITSMFKLCLSIKTARVSTPTSELHEEPVLPW